MRGKFRSDTGIDGLLIVDKPLHLSSMDVVRRVRRAASHTKTGHAGTLDPLATGVVICCLGKATRCVERLMDLPKVYEATVDLSAFTTTDDLEGQVEVVTVEERPNRAAIDAAVAAHVGHIEQRPPAYSAVHVGGQRAYRLARAGAHVQMPTRVVRIDAIEVLGYHWPELLLRVTCGRGTYVRSLARQLGQALGTGGHLASLRRTAVGDYTVERAMTVEQIEATPITAKMLLPMPR